MANDEVLGPRKTMFVLVIVVGCFAVLWPRILSPLILGQTRDQIKPNKFDREAGCCEVIFETDVAVLELVNEVCNSALGVGRLSPNSALECRKAVNETCGVDIIAFLKRNENVGKTTKMLVETMKNSNSSCLREHFGVPIYSLSNHFAANPWTHEDIVKQERPPIRLGTHPALREKGRAIPPGTPAPTKPVVLPAHLRVRSPLSVYYETVDVDVKPPPIPGMRPPLGSPGGPVPAPKTSMGFVMPIYTICIIVFFVYTLSKILFKRTGSSPYEPVAPDPQFRQRVFRDNSRTSPDKFGDEELAALRARLAETERTMKRIIGQLAQRNAETVDSTRPYTNGTILLNSGPVQIVTSEYQESKEKISRPQNEIEPIIELKEPVVTDEYKNEQEQIRSDNEKLTKTPLEIVEEIIDESNDAISVTDVIENEFILESKQEADTELEQILEPENITVTAETVVDNNLETQEENVDTLAKLAEDFLNEERIESTSELLKEALEEDIEYGKITEEDKDNQSVKVIGMEVTAHSADGGAVPRAPAPPAPAPRSHEAKDVTSIFLDTEIPQQTRVLVADFAEDTSGRPQPKDSSLVVSGKITLSLIQDAPRDTPERDPESTVDEFTTASALTQAAEKEDDLSDGELEEVDEEIEIEEIEEEIEVEEDEEDEVDVEESDLKGKK